MTVEQAARRLGVDPWQVASVREHPAGHLAQLRTGRVKLITATVARDYRPTIDDPRSQVPAGPVATGGPAGRPVLVGESGPELVAVRRRGRKAQK